LRPAKILQKIFAQTFAKIFAKTSTKFYENTFYHFCKKQNKNFRKTKFCDNTLFIPVNVAPPHGSPAGNIRVNIAQPITMV